MGERHTHMCAGVDAAKFAMSRTDWMPFDSASARGFDRPESWPQYEYDLGFTGVIRSDQTNNWRYRIWKSAWPILKQRGLRLYSGDRGGVHIGVAHTELNVSEYISKMRASKLWLSTTGPAALVGTRYFEVMATGTTLCVCNRMVGNSSIVYNSLGIKEGRHVVMFESLAEFVDIVTNYTLRHEYDAHRFAMVRRAQEVAFKRFTWTHVASRIDRVVHESIHKHRNATTI